VLYFPLYDERQHFKQLLSVPYLLEGTGILSIATMPSILSSSSPLSKLSNLDTDDTSSLRPSDSTEVEEKKWSDAELMDDSRPGRRGTTDDQRWKYSAPKKTKNEKDLDEGEYLPHPLDVAVDNEEGRVHEVKSWYHAPADGVKAGGWFKNCGGASKGT